MHTFVFDPAGRNLRSVHAAGTFNDWAATVAASGWPLTYVPSRGVWAATRNLPFGHHQYRFVLDESEWTFDPGNPIRSIHGGVENSAVAMRCNAQCDAGDPTATDWRDGVMYFAMVDRFFDSDGQGRAPDPNGGSDDNPRAGYGGGDLAGVTAKLPYLADLGVTVVWLSAPYANANGGYHGYWPAPDNIDYGNPTQPNPRPRVEGRIGSEAALRDLVTQAHGASTVDGAGMRVLLDYVMNHVHEASGLHNAHRDWFYRDNGWVRECNNGTPDNPNDDLWNDAYWGTRCGFNGFLPPFDFDGRADARAWSVSDATWWADEFGVDGFRLDAIKHVPTLWLEELRRLLSQRIPQPTGGRFYLVGETFDFDRAYLRSFINPATRLDGQFDFPFRANLCEAVLSQTRPLHELAAWLEEENDGFYGDDAVMTTWIGNHDLPRPIHAATGEIGCSEASTPDNSHPNQYSRPGATEPYERLALAYAVLMTNPGLPLIYYGDEVGLAGGGDPESRRMMPWSASSLLPVQVDLRRRVRDLARLRSAHRTLSRGQRVTVSVSVDTWVYTLVGCHPDLMPITVALNRSDQPQSIAVPPARYRELPSGTPHAGGAVPLPARSYLLLEHVDPLTGP